MGANRTFCSVRVRELFEEDKNPANEFGGPVSDIVPTGAYAHMNAMMLMKVNTLKGVKNMRNNDKFSEDIGVYWDKQKKKWMTKDPA